jgi:hypothetical protein
MAIINTAMNQAENGSILKSGLGLAGKAFVPVTAGISGIGTFFEDRKKGHGYLYSGAHGIASAWAQTVLWAPMLALQVAPWIGQMHRINSEAIGEQQRQQMKMSPYRYKDTPYAQNARAQALQAIQESKGRASGYLGREAGLFATRYR